TDSQKEVRITRERWGSWVELHFNNGGGSTPKGGSEEQSASTAPSGDLEKMLLDAQHESGRSSSRGSLPCESPPRSRTPSHLSRGSESEEDYLERRREVEILMKKNADWIWDWSSRPENLPPKEFVLRHPKRSSTLSMRLLMLLIQCIFLFISINEMFIMVLVLVDNNKPDCFGS
uniref:BCL2/adenovirus E1B 19 kDa protein-interacting protein 3-like n=1 Tax=Sinocyclocheilus anshuiensis TaxID=1608454 RepID=A0A671PTH9_9TELE